jgi:hypothetical protein
MQAGKQISRLALAAMIAIVVGAPAAGAMPAQDGQSYEVNRVTGEYTRATAGPDKHVATPAGSDLRTEGAKSPIVSKIDTPPLGLPTWPENPTPVVTAAPQPVAATDSGDGSFDWPLAGLIAGGVIALAGAALLTRQQMRGQAPAH